MEENQQYDIDLIKISQKIVENRRKFFVFPSLFAVIFFLTSFLFRLEYTSTMRLMPELLDESQVSGGIGDLAGLVGVNLNLGGNASLKPEIYPEIVNSTSFIQSILNEQIFVDMLGDSVSGLDYFTKYLQPSPLDNIFRYTIGLPSLFSESESMEYSEEDDILIYSKSYYDLIENYKKRIKVDLDFSSGVLNIAVSMPDKLVAAQTTRIVFRNLTKEVTNYRLQKAHANLDFLNERFEETSMVYNESRLRVARFAQTNKNLNSSIAQIEYKRLQDELNIQYEVYKNVATQLEQAKIKVKEQTPVFKVLEQAKVPIKKSDPKRFLFVLIGVFFGFSFSIFIILKKQLFG